MGVEDVLGEEADGEGSTVILSEVMETGTLGLESATEEFVATDPSGRMIFIGTRLRGTEGPMDEVLSTSSGWVR